jgi:hypothetical protein
VGPGLEVMVKRKAAFTVNFNAVRINSMGESGLHSCGPGYGPVAGFCEYGNEHQCVRKGRGIFVKGALRTFRRTLLYSDCYIEGFPEPIAFSA